MNEHGRKCKCAACLAERRDYMPRLPGAVDPSWQAFAKIVLMNTPHLDGAKCRGHSDLFDRHPHNDPHRVIDKDIAEHMCATCPALGACRTWLASLPPYLRPAGVVAGHMQAQPTGSLPTGRHGGRPPKAWTPNRRFPSIAR